MNRLFLVAAGLIALHVADDSFLQPQPGTGAADHLVSGLVPLAVLGRPAAPPPRPRRRPRAVLALLTGLFGIAAGAEAIFYAQHGGPAGDDFTGLLAVPAGLALVGAGAATLWTSRRRDGRRVRRYARRTGLGVAGLLVTSTFVLPVLMAYGFTHIARPADDLVELPFAHERVTLTTDDGLRLDAYYVPSRNGAAVIAYPGRNGPRRHAEMLARHGYGVLLVDRRGEGRSDGDPHAFGWTFAGDIRAGIAFLERRRDVEPGRIGGLGLSVGGEMMLHAAASEPALAAVVSEGAGARVVGEELDDLDGLEKLLAAPALYAKTAALAVFSDTSPPPNLTELIPRIAPRPVLLIHARENEVDAKTPEYLAAAGEHGEAWEVPEGGHTDGIEARPEEYERRVVGFFDRALRR